MWVRIGERSACVGENREEISTHWLRIDGRSACMSYNIGEISIDG